MGVPGFNIISNCHTAKSHEMFLIYHSQPSHKKTCNAKMKRKSSTILRRTIPVTKVSMVSMATRTDAFDKFMTEATSMVLPAIKLKFSVGAVARVGVAGGTLHQTRTLGTALPVETTVCTLLG